MCSSRCSHRGHWLLPLFLPFSKQGVAMVTVTFPVFSEVQQHSLTRWLSSLLLLSHLSHLASAFSSPLLASLTPLTPSFSSASLSVSVICFSPPLPVAGVKYPQLLPHSRALAAPWRTLLDSGDCSEDIFLPQWCHNAW